MAAAIKGMAIISTSVLCEYGMYQLVSQWVGGNAFFYQVLCDGFDLMTFNSTAFRVAQEQYDRLVAARIAHEDREARLA